MESTFFEALAERGPGYYSWEWHIHYRPLFTHVRRLNLFGDGFERNSWEIGHDLQSRSCHTCSGVVLVNCRTS
jgi:hypothetical protein